MHTFLIGVSEFMCIAEDAVDEDDEDVDAAEITAITPILVITNGDVFTRKLKD
jgi:hypothetical protein